MAKGTFFLPGITYSTENFVGTIIFQIQSLQETPITMKNRFKLQYLPVLALFLAAGTAVATKSPDKPKNALVATWERTAPNATSTGSWQEVSGQPCQASDKICKADFATGYDPRTHTEAQNTSAAISGSVQQGFVQQ